MTMTKAQRAKKKIEDKKHLRHRILTYTIAILAVLSIVKDYNHAQEIAVLQLQVHELQQEALRNHHDVATNYMTRTEINELFLETFEVDMTQANQIQFLAEGFFVLQQDKQERDEAEKPPTLPPSI